MFFRLAGLRLLTADSRFDGYNRLYLVSPCLHHGKAKASGPAMKQQTAGTRLVYQRGIGAAQVARACSASCFRMARS